MPDRRSDSSLIGSLKALLPSGAFYYLDFACNYEKPRESLGVDSQIVRAKVTALAAVAQIILRVAIDYLT